MNLQKNIQGFTFIELAVVIFILGLLAGVGIPAYNKVREKARVTKTRANLQAINSFLEAYQMDTGKYPKTLEALVTDIEKAAGWDGPYLKGKGVPTDGWNNEFKYSVDPKNPAGYVLYSMGPKGEEASREEWIEE